VDDVIIMTFDGKLVLVLLNHHKLLLYFYLST
jgi:hypothetical protein